MPEDETLTSFENRLIAMAKRVVAQQGGAIRTDHGDQMYVIRREALANVERLPYPKAQDSSMRSQLRPEIEKGLTAQVTSQEKARAAYLAICLELAPAFAEKYPQQWAEAISALSRYPNVLQVIFYEAPFPAGDAIRQKALSAGLQKPETSIKIWT